MTRFEAASVVALVAMRMMRDGADYSAPGVPNHTSIAGVLALTDAEATWELATAGPEYVETAKLLGLTCP